MPVLSMMEADNVTIIGTAIRKGIHLQSVSELRSYWVVNSRVGSYAIAGWNDSVLLLWKILQSIQIAAILNNSWKAKWNPKRKSDHQIVCPTGIKVCVLKIWGKVTALTIPTASKVFFSIVYAFEVVTICYYLYLFKALLWMLGHVWTYLMTYFKQRLYALTENTNQKSELSSLEWKVIIK